MLKEKDSVLNKEEDRCWCMLSPVQNISYRNAATFAYTRQRTTVSFGSLGSAIQKFPKEKFINELVNSEIPLNNDDYRFLLRNPRGFYLEFGKLVNEFLRTGKFKELSKITGDLPEPLRKILAGQIQEQKELNRVILESIDILDGKFTSRTPHRMTVWRDAPKSWMEEVQNGILTDKAYLSTSTVRGASLEGVVSNGANNRTYEIRLKENTPFWDFTDTQEKEMLLRRDCKFKVLAPYVLELI